VAYSNWLWQRPCWARLKRTRPSVIWNSIQAGMFYGVGPRPWSFSGQPN